MTSNITERAKALTKNAAKLRAEHHKAITERDSLITRLAAGDASVNPDELTKVNAAIERLDLLAPAAHANAKEASWLASLAGPAHHPTESFTAILVGILDGHIGIVKAVTENDDFTGADFFLTQKNAATRRQASSRVDGRRNASLSIVAKKAIDATLIKRRLSDLRESVSHFDGLGIELQQHSRQAHGDWLAYTIKVSDEFPDTPAASEIRAKGLRSKAALVDMENYLVNRLGDDGLVIERAQWSEHSSRLRDDRTTFLKVRSHGAHFVSEDVGKEGISTLVATFDIETARYQSDIGSDDDMRDAIMRVARTTLLSVHFPGRIVKVAVEKVRKGSLDVDAYVWRITQTGVCFNDTSDAA